MRQTSLIVDPPNGRFPALTHYGKKLQAEMKSSYRPGQTVFDSVDDFAAWDRCITRGMPVSMEPRNYNNGIRIMQSPGYVVILLEMAHEARVIPTTGMPPLDSNIKEWMGESRGHWEGNTLVVETTNFNGLVGADQRRGPRLPGPLQPETPNMKITEWFTRVAHDTIEFKMKVEDPTVLATGSYTVGVPDVPRQQVPDLRVLLPRREHSGAGLHRNVALRTRAPQREEVVTGKKKSRLGNGSRFQRLATNAIQEAAPWPAPRKPLQWFVRYASGQREAYQDLWGAGPATDGGLDTEKPALLETLGTRVLHPPRFAPFLNGC